MLSSEPGLPGRGWARAQASLDPQLLAPISRQALQPLPSVVAASLRDGAGKLAPRRVARLDRVGMPRPHALAAGFRKPTGSLAEASNPAQKRRLRGGWNPLPKRCGTQRGALSPGLLGVKPWAPRSPLSPSLRRRCGPSFCPPSFWPIETTNSFSSFKTWVQSHLLREAPTTPAPKSVL